MPLAHLVSDSESKDVVVDLKKTDQLAPFLSRVALSDVIMNGEKLPLLYGSQIAKRGHWSCCKSTDPFAPPCGWMPKADYTKPVSISDCRKKIPRDADAVKDDSVFVFDL